MKRRKTRVYDLNSKTELLRPYSYHLALCLRHLRKAKWIYQDRLAEKLGVSQQVISYYESGWANPSLIHLIKLADFFGVTVNDLIDPKVCPKSLFKKVAKV